MRYFRWAQGSTDPGQALGLYEAWYLNIVLAKHNQWDLMAGRRIDDWDPEVIAYQEGGTVQVDFPFTSPDLPVHSPKLRWIVEHHALSEVQYLPLRILHQNDQNEVEGYCIANYLTIVDCVDRERAAYEIWTEDNLLYWEKRPHLLGTFRDITKLVLNSRRISNLSVFRLWGWEMVVIVREDLKQAIEAAALTGCRFTEIEIW